MKPTICYIYMRQFFIIIIKRIFIIQFSLFHLLLSPVQLRIKIYCKKNKKKTEAPVHIYQLLLSKQSIQLRHISNYNFEPIHIYSQRRNKSKLILHRFSIFYFYPVVQCWKIRNVADRGVFNVFRIERGQCQRSCSIST